MSSDNFIITVTAKKGAIALYDLQHSDFGGEVSLESPRHELSVYVVKNFPNRLIGVAESEEALKVMVQTYCENHIVEYGLIPRHK